MRKVSKETLIVATHKLMMEMSDEEIDRVMRQIPQDKKSVFDKDLISSITQLQYS